MCRSHSYKSRGFTLIEMLVALAIMAALSVAAYQVLFQVQLSNSVSEKTTTRLNEVQRAMVIMTSDFRQMATRQFRTEDESPSKQLLLWKSRLLGTDSYGVVFTRLGWLNPLNQFPRGEVTKVGYRFDEDENRLERIWWRYPDTTSGDTGIVMPLLTQVESFSLRFFYDKRWRDEWTENGVLPEAVAVKIELKDYGVIERVFLVAGSELGDGSGGEEKIDE